MKTIPGGSIRRSANAVLAAAGLLAAADSVLAMGACSVTSTGMAFGAYQPLTLAGKVTSQDKTSTATVSMVCTGIVVGGSYTASLGAGTYGDIGIRKLNNATHPGEPYMAFNVYTDANHATVWGNGTSGALLSGSIPTGNSNSSHTVYGRIPAGQSTLKAGSYGDSMTMTITYNP